MKPINKLALTTFLTAIVTTQPALAATYEKTPEDYTYKTAYIQNFQVINKQYGVGPKYKELHLIYKETPNGRDISTPCVASVCNKILKQNGEFSKYIGRHVKFQIDDRMDNNDQLEKVIMNLKIIK